MTGSDISITAKETQLSPKCHHLLQTHFKSGIPIYDGKATSDIRKHVETDNLSGINFR